MERRSPGATPYGRSGSDDQVLEVERKALERHLFGIVEWKVTGATLTWQGIEVEWKVGATLTWQGIKVEWKATGATLTWGSGTFRYR